MFHCYCAARPRARRGLNYTWTYTYKQHEFWYLHGLYINLFYSCPYLGAARPRARRAVVVNKINTDVGVVCVCVCG